MQFCISLLLVVSSFPFSPSSPSPSSTSCFEDSLSSPPSCPLPLSFRLFHRFSIALCQNPLIALFSQWVAMYTYCYPSLSLSLLPPFSLSVRSHTQSHTLYTQPLIPGLSGPFNFHSPVVLTSPPSFNPATLFLLAHWPSSVLICHPSQPYFSLLYLFVQNTADVTACQSALLWAFLTSAPLSCQSLASSPQDVSMDVIKIP